MAEVKVRELLPDLPHPPIEQSSRVSQSRPAVRKITERELLDYIVNNGGFLDIEHFSKVYGVEKQEVVKLLEVLKSKGLIAVES